MHKLSSTSWCRWAACAVPHSWNRISCSLHLDVDDSLCGSGFIGMAQAAHLHLDVDDSLCGSRTFWDHTGSHLHLDVDEQLVQFPSLGTTRAAHLHLDVDNSSCGSPLCWTTQALYSWCRWAACAVPDHRNGTSCSSTSWCRQQLTWFAELWNRTGCRLHLDVDEQLMRFWTLEWTMRLSSTSWCRQQLCVVPERSGNHTGCRLHLDVDEQLVQFPSLRGEPHRLSSTSWCRWQLVWFPSLGTTQAVIYILM